MTTKTTRPSLESTYAEMALLIAKRSTCTHRDQGAALVLDDHLISVGYNGSAPGQPHCIDLGSCAKAENLPCRAEGLHAESNAIAFAAKLGISIAGATLFTVYSPCRTCCNILKVAGIERVLFISPYSGFLEGPAYLEEIGIECLQIITLTE